MNEYFGPPDTLSEWIETQLLQSVLLILSHACCLSPECVRVCFAPAIVPTKRRQIHAHLTDIVVQCVDTKHLFDTGGQPLLTS